MKKLILISTVIIGITLFNSCNKNELLQEVLTNQELQLTAFAIPIEDALAELYSISGLFPEFKERFQSLQNSTHPNVEILYFDHTTKRVIAPSNQLFKNGGLGDNLIEQALYLVNFEEGGYAILAADTRLCEQILAISDGGSISLNDFLSTSVKNVNIDELPEGFQFQDSETGEYYIGSNTAFDALIIKDYVNFKMENCTISSGEPPYPGRDFYFNYTLWVDHYVIPGMIQTTSWHQGAPFNQFFPLKGSPSKPASVGCVALAVGQIIAHHGQVAPSSWGMSSTWSQIRGYRGFAHHPSTLSTDVGSFLLQISNGMNSVMTSGGTYALSSSAWSYLVSYGGIHNASLRLGWNNTNENRIVNMIKAGKPVFISAASGTEGHAWIIDGLKYQQRTATPMCKNTHEVLGPPVIQSRTMLHNVWGWGGGGNGFLASGVFKPEGYNDNYTWGFHIITY
jgi:hypothetical protein